MKQLLLSILIIIASEGIYAQEPTRLTKETKQQPDGKYIILEKNEKGDTLISGYLSSIDPEIRQGKFSFYKENKLFANGFYTDNLPSGVWQYYDKNGLVSKEVNYDNTIRFLTADTLKIKPLYFSVPINPHFVNRKYDSFMEYIKKNVVYPANCSVKNLTDTVFVSFNITSEGKVSNIEVLRSSGNIDFNMEVIRVISESPIWEAGEVDGKKTNVAFTHPVFFEKK